jgi:LacI family transcriptional regulator
MSATINVPSKPPAERTVSIRDVASLARVSAGTVSNALNHPEKVKPHTLAEVENAVRKLGFVRNEAARQLRHGTSRTVGIVLPDVSNPFYLDIIRGAEKAAEREGLMLMIGNTDASSERESRYLASFEQQRAHGIIIAPVFDKAPAIARTHARGIPVVQIGGRPSGPGVPFVGMDDVEGGRIAAQHLIQRGVKRILFVGGPTSTSQVEDRLIGTQAAIAGCSNVSLAIIPTEGQTVAAGRLAGIEILALPRGAQPDAIFAANDLLAIGIIQTLNSWAPGIVPGRILVIGYDDIPTPQYDNIALTTICQPASEMGGRAIELLLTGNKERQFLFAPQLVERESTRSNRARLA